MYTIPAGGCEYSLLFGCQYYGPKKWKCKPISQMFGLQYDPMHQMLSPPIQPHVSDTWSSNTTPCLRWLVLQYNPMSQMFGLQYDPMHQMRCPPIRPHVRLRCVVLQYDPMSQMLGPPIRPHASDAWSSNTTPCLRHLGPRDHPTQPPLLASARSGPPELTLTPCVRRFAGGDRRREPGQVPQGAERAGGRRGACRHRRGHPAEAARQEPILRLRLPHLRQPRGTFSTTALGLLGAGFKEREGGS